MTEVVIFMIINLCLVSKNVAKALKKITARPVRERGVTWIPELVNKCKWMSKCTVFTQVYPQVLTFTIQSHGCNV